MTWCQTSLCLPSSKPCGPWSSRTEGHHPTLLLKWALVEELTAYYLCSCYHILLMSFNVWLIHRMCEWCFALLACQFVCWPGPLCMKQRNEWTSEWMNILITGSCVWCVFSAPPNQRGQGSMSDQSHDCVNKSCESCCRHDSVFWHYND